MSKFTHKYGLLSVWILLLAISISLHSCASSKENKEPNAEEISKELRKQKKKELNKAQKAAEKAKKEFWSKQTPEMKRLIRESNKRQREQHKMRNKKRKK